MRPFGVSLLLAGRDENGPQLYQIDPSGSYFAWKASAIGKNYSNAKTFLEKRCVIYSLLSCIQVHWRQSWRVIIPAQLRSLLGCRALFAVLCMPPDFPACELQDGSLCHMSCGHVAESCCNDPLQVCGRYGAGGRHPHGAVDAQGGLRGPDCSRQHRGDSHSSALPTNPSCYCTQRSVSQCEWQPDCSWFNACRLASTNEDQGFLLAQVGIVGEDNKFRVLTAAEVADYLEEVE